MAEIVVEKSEWTVKFAGSHSCAGLGVSRGKKLGVAPRSSDLSSWWQNISEGHGLYGEGRIVGMIQIFKDLNKVVPPQSFSETERPCLCTFLRSKFYFFSPDNLLFPLNYFNTSQFFKHHSIPIFFFPTILKSTINEVFSTLTIFPFP